LPIHIVGSKKKLTAENLEALGAKRLAGLLIELAENNAATGRRLRLELAAQNAPVSVAAELRKRLAQIARSRSYVDWQGIRGLAADLHMQRRMIVERVATIDANDALELMWRFMELTRSVQERCDDSNGVIGEVFSTACGDLGPLARAANPDPVALASRVFAALQENDYGQYDDLIAALAPVLGNKGLDDLKRRISELAKTPVEKPPQDKRKVIGWGAGGEFYEDELEASSRANTIRHALQEIADVEGDVDSFIAQYDAKSRKMPAIAAEIARRLLASGRAEDALKTLKAATPGRDGRVDFDWEDARIDTLDALGRSDEAQAARWSCFDHTLSAEHLRAYLKRLPDFDDLEAEERALDHVERFQDLLFAIAFLVSWPALERAARLVTRRVSELDGDDYEILSPTAQALAGKYPLAATLALRAMIDFTLTKARSSRYRHAARHLMECASLASTLADFGDFESHDTYIARLKAQHGRKSGFWNLVS
jgi:hypothetical protein